MYAVDMNAYQRMSENVTAHFADTPVEDVQTGHSVGGMEYPVSGDVIAIMREAHAINEPELGLRIIHERTSY